MQMILNLFALVHVPARPVLERAVDLRERLRVVLLELDARPEISRRVRAFNCLVVKIANALLLYDRRVLTARPRRAALV